LTREGYVEQVYLQSLSFSPPSFNPLPVINSSPLIPAQVLGTYTHLSQRFFFALTTPAMDCNMEIGSPTSESSARSKLAVYEPDFHGPDVSGFDVYGSAAYAPTEITEHAVTSCPVDSFPDAPASSHPDQIPELTAHVPGDNATHHNHAPPTTHTPQFDPRALLNPTSSNSKRPASSGNDTDRGRIDPTIAGQVSLVERLHNVQERTSSPAKRIKTEEPRRQKNANRTNFTGGSALELQNGQSPAPLPQQGSAIDLTMSDDEDDIQVIHDNSNDDVCIGKLKQTYIQAHLVPFPDPKKFAGNHGGQSRIKVSFRRGGGHKGNQIIMVRSKKIRPTWYID
jgi:hypothetical protein